MCLQENIQPAEDEDFAVKDDSGPALGKAFAAAADQLHSISVMPEIKKEPQGRRQNQGRGRLDSPRRSGIGRRVVAA